LSGNRIGDDGANWIAAAVIENDMLLKIDLYDNRIGIVDIESANLEENWQKKNTFDRKIICAFTEHHKGLIRLGFDMMILQCLYYPILGTGI
jgi:hypothetical protein